MSTTTCSVSSGSERFLLLTPAFIFPLSNVSVDSAGMAGVILISESAHTFPPIGAQRLNLGLKDAADLSANGREGMRGLANMRIVTEFDPNTQRMSQISTRINFHDAERTIYLDGRPHPPAEAPHSWGGFSTRAE